MNLKRIIILSLITAVSVLVLFSMMALIVYPDLTARVRYGVSTLVYDASTRIKFNFCKITKGNWVTEKCGISRCVNKCLY